MGISFIAGICDCKITVSALYQTQSPAIHLARAWAILGKLGSVDVAAIGEYAEVFTQWRGRNGSENASELAMGWEEEVPKPLLVAFQENRKQGTPVSSTCLFPASESEPPRWNTRR